MTNDPFYQDLPSFDEISGITDTKNFSPIPINWFIIITDVKGSTKAIESGRYKEINTIGAAAIVSARKAMGAVEFFFVFGGDGATIL